MPNVLDSRLATAGTEVGDVLGELVPSGGADVARPRGGILVLLQPRRGRPGRPGRHSRRSSRTARRAPSPRASPGGPPPGGGRAGGRTPGVEFYLLADLTGAAAGAADPGRGAGGRCARGDGGRCRVRCDGRADGRCSPWSRWPAQPRGSPAASSPPGCRPPTTRTSSRIVASFNSMVDALSARIERDARFVGDVSHELRSPLTTLVTSVEVLGARRQDLSQRAAAGARPRRVGAGPVPADAGGPPPAGPSRRRAHALDTATSVSMSALVREVLADRGGAGIEISVAPDEETVVRGDKASLERAVRNLLDNADRHAGGATAVSVERRHGERRGRRRRRRRRDRGRGPRADLRAVRPRGARRTRLPAGGGARPGDRGGDRGAARRRGLVHDGSLRRGPVLHVAPRCPTSDPPTTDGGGPVGRADARGRLRRADRRGAVDHRGVRHPVRAGRAQPDAVGRAQCDPQLDPSRIFLVGEGDLLVPRPRDTDDGSSRRQRLEELLTALAEGPTGAERGDELSTALSPEVQLSLAELSDGTATIDIDGSVEAPSGGASRRAVGADRADRDQRAGCGRRPADPRGRTRRGAAAVGGAHLGAAERRRLRHPAGAAGLAAELTGASRRRRHAASPGAAADDQRGHSAFPQVEARFVDKPVSRGTGRRPISGASATIR